MQDQDLPRSAPSEPAAPPTARLAARPADVPAKFWDADAGSVRVEALLKSYLELEHRLGAAEPDLDADPAARQRLLASLGWPAGPDDYRIEPPHGLIEPDAAVNARLHAAGFTQAQAQLVYELAVDRLLPMLAEVIGALEARRHQERLERHFGGSEAWRETQRQLRTWAEASLEPDTYRVLAGSAEGVLALHQMMRASEPDLLDAGGGAVALTEANLRELMRDPRYWRDRDPEIIRRVTDGYRRLYPA